MVLRTPGPVENAPLALASRDVPEPAPGEILVRVDACAVCRTDLHLVEGDLPARRSEIIPGHQIVGRVTRGGPGAARFGVGDRVGVAWLRRACGECSFCRDGRENLCTAPEFTGWDRDGGYAEYLCVPEDFAYALPAAISPEGIAPLLCAGIIGFRAYARCRVRPGQRLGIYGFGGSAHIAIQVARHHGCQVYVFSRGDAHRELANRLGAHWIGRTHDMPPQPLHAAIVFAPAGEIVPPALASLERGGTVAIAGIHLSDIPPLDYARHLFQERTLCSVTANTREDGRELLRLAEAIPIETRTRAYRLEDANEALADLKHDRVEGSAVLIVRGEVA